MVKTFPPAKVCQSLSANSQRADSSLQVSIDLMNTAANLLSFNASDSFADGQHPEKCAVWKEYILAEGDILLNVGHNHNDRDLIVLGTEAGGDRNADGLNEMMGTRGGFFTRLLRRLYICYCWFCFAFGANQIIYYR